MYSFEAGPIGALGKHMMALRKPPQPSVPVSKATDEELRAAIESRVGFISRMGDWIGALDGLLTTTTPDFAPALADAMQTFYTGETGQPTPIFNLGPWHNTPETVGHRSTKMNNDVYPTDDGRMLRFLDQALETKGKHSVAYVK